jgi:hypothetical protein
MSSCVASLCHSEEPKATKNLKGFFAALRMTKRGGMKSMEMKKHGE